MEPLPIALKVSVEVEANGQSLRIVAQVEGEGEAARQAAAEIASAVASVLAKTSPNPGAAASQAVPAPEPAAPINSVELPSVAPTGAASMPSPMMSWIRRNRAGVNIGFGALLLALALLMPLIVPPDQRSEVLVMTILFGLTGALLLFTALLPGRGREDTIDRSSSSAMRAQKLMAPASSITPQGRTEKLHTLRTPGKGKPMKAGRGVALGLAFVLAGLLAPFALGTVTADERFIIMLGFAPITVVGFFMIAIFWRGLFGNLPIPSKPALKTPKVAGAGAAVAKRPPVTRVPQTFEYRAIVPTAIVASLILLIVVVALVAFATAASVAR